MFKLVLATAILVCAESLAAVPVSISATNTDVLFVRGTHASTCEFIEKNTVSIIGSADAVVLGQDDGLIKVKKTHRKEVNVFTLKSEGSKGDYKLAFVQSIQGNLTDCSTEFTVDVDDKGLTRVTIVMKATVVNSRLNQRDLMILLKRATGGIKSYLEKNVR